MRFGEVWLNNADGGAQNSGLLKWWYIVTVGPKTSFQMQLLCLLATVNAPLLLTPGVKSQWHWL